MPATSVVLWERSGVIAGNIRPLVKELPVQLCEVRSPQDFDGAAISHFAIAIISTENDIGDLLDRWEILGSLPKRFLA